MSDADLRELERRFRETGSSEDEVAWLLERVRAGELEMRRLHVAACCGYPAATLAASSSARVSESLLGVLLDLREFGEAAWIAAAAVIAAEHYGDDAPTSKDLRRMRDGLSTDRPKPEFGEVMRGARFVLSRKRVKPRLLRERVLAEVAAWALGYGDRA